jgi:hypothetical protein
VRRTAARLLVVALSMLASLALAGPASAHVGGGVAGSDFDGQVISLSPNLPGVTARVLQFGDDVELVNRSGTEVEVPGYDGEPYLRIGPDGVWRNQRSPATYINLDRYARVTLPESADSHAEPQWVQLSTEPHFVWHDHRTHWMTQGLLPPAVAADPDHSHTVFEWTIPLRYGNTSATVQGVLTWTPPPSPWLVWPLYAVPLLLAAGAGLLAHTVRPLGALMLVGAGAALWHAGATPVPAVSVSSHTGAILAALLPALVAAVVAGIGFWAARRGRGAMSGLLAVVLGWLLLVQGLPDVDVLWSANVLTNGPEVVGRVAVALLLALGAGFVVGGIAAVRRFREVAVPSGSIAPERTSPT